MAAIAHELNLREIAMPRPKMTRFFGDQSEASSQSSVALVVGHEEISKPLPYADVSNP